MVDWEECVPANGHNQVYELVSCVFVASQCINKIISDIPQENDYLALRIKDLTKFLPMEG
jgi:hypothetical protein